MLQRLTTIVAHIRSNAHSPLDRLASIRTGAVRGRTTRMMRLPQGVGQGIAVLGILSLGPGLLGSRDLAGSTILKSDLAPALSDAQATHASFASLSTDSSIVLGDYFGPALPASIADSSAILEAAQPPAGAAAVEATMLATDTPQPMRHTVRPGDTVRSIAASYGVSPETIVKANLLANPDHIQVGHRLALREGERTASTTPGAGSNEAFILNMVDGAQTSQRLTGIPASVTLAQAILETYWGSSFLAREANNYFGIKAYAKPGSAGVVWITAWEVENGKDVNRQEPFRAYNTPGESLVDHGKFFLENSRYAHALMATDDPREFARRINAAGYATDPAYASKLILYMDRYNLYQWDVTP